MRNIILSDHTAYCLNQKEAARASEYQAGLKAYEYSLSERQQGIDSLRAERARAWHDKKILQTIKYTLKSFFATFSSKPARPLKRAADNSDFKLASGREGEQRVSDYLTAQLDDSWCLISGYKNWKGEIDRILVGHAGIFAIEVKNINGRIYCNGDRWWKDKEDRYGNLVEWDSPIQDKKGRSPSRQLNEPADMLQNFLQRTWPDCFIYRLVIFTHSSSRFEDLNNLTVNEARLVDNWNIQDTFQRSGFKLSQPDIERAVQKIEQDHRYREKKDRSKNQGPRQQAVGREVNTPQRIEDLDIQQFKVELRALENEFATLASKKAEITKTIHDFNVRYHQALGELTNQLLKLKRDKLRQDAGENPGKRAEYEEAEQDYQNFNTTFEGLKSCKLYELSDSERKELKTKYHMASRLCHPDMVADEFKKRAAEIFCELSQAYKENDLQTVRDLLQMLDHGGIFINASDSLSDAERLKRQIAIMRRRITTLKTDIETLMRDESYQVISKIGNWDDYIAQIKSQLETEINRYKQSIHTEVYHGQ